MADGDKKLCSSNLKIFGLKNTDICLIKSLNDKAHLIYDGVRLKWTQDFCSLKNFIENVVGLKGVWKSPGGNSKQLTSTNFDLNITWYPGKQNSLLPHGKDGELLKKLLTSVLNNDCKRCDKTSDGFHAAIARGKNHLIQSRLRVLLKKRSNAWRTIRSTLRALQMHQICLKK